MNKELELHLEEQRSLLIALKELQAETNKALNELSSKYVQPQKQVEVSGEVKVNTQKEVEVTNLESLQLSLEDMTKQLETAIKTNKPLSNVTVSNITEAIPTEIKVSNIPAFTHHIEHIVKAIQDNQPIVNVEKQDIQWPTSPKNPISVRLSNGRNFYDAIAQAIVEAGQAEDKLADYQICDRAEDSYPKYYGYARPNGAWYIMRESAAGAYRYARGEPNINETYISAWDNKASLNYGYIFEVF